MTDITTTLPDSLVIEIQALVEPDIAEMQTWDASKINAAKLAGAKMQTEEYKEQASLEFYAVFSDAD